MSWIALDTWPRRAIYDFFLSFDDPWFNLTAEVDVTATRAWCREHGQPFSLACWFVVQRASEHVPELRMRLRPEGVWLHDRLRVGATVLRADGAFTYAYFPSHDSFAAFAEAAAAEQRARLAQAGLAPDDGGDDLLHCTMVPWVRFTGMKHARQGGRADSVPKVALGKATDTRDGVVMPVNIQAHHALADGLHVGRFLAEVQRLLDEPAATFA